MRRRTRGVRLVVLAIAVVAAIPAVAQARPPQGPQEFVLDSDPNAGRPSVAVDSAGTAHFVWNESQPAQPGDILHYCRVPRNGRSCEHELTFTVPPFPETSATDFDGPKVFAPSPGQIVIATSRCCTADLGGTRVFVFTSSDGGTSFSGPVEIGTIDLDSARIGPGPFSLSGAAQRTGGTYFQAMPLAGPLITEQVNLGAIENTIGAAFDGSIAFADPFTPIVAMNADDRVYFRRYGGGTAYNDLASWGPLTPVAKGSEARLAGLLNGKGGIHLLTSVHMPAGRESPAGFQYVSRRYNAATCQMPSGKGCFEPPVPVSERGDPIFREFFADPSGRQHALWVDNSDDSLKHRRSLQGEKWDEIETLLTKGRADDVYNISSDAAADGGGFAVYDANGSGPVRAVQYGPTGPVSGDGTGGSECVDSASIGHVIVAAQDGCLLHEGDRYTTSDDVRVNGIDLIVGDSKVTIDAGERTLTTAGDVEARIGNVILGQQALQWRLPQGDGQIRDLAGNPAEFHTGEFGVELLGLDVLGYTVPEVVGAGKIAVPVNLELPQPFSTAVGDDVTGGIVLHATNEGVELGTLDIQITDVSLGIARIKDFTLHYASGPPELLQGDTEIAIPPTYTTPSIEAGFGLRDGEFDYANGGISFGDNQLLIATDIFLKRIEFAVQAAQGCDVPTTISGEVTFTTGPELAGASLIEVVGGASFTLPQGKCGTPGKFAITGAGKVAGLQVVTLSTSFTTDLQFEFATEIDIDVEAARVYVKIAGGLDIPAGAFYASGEANIDVIGITLVDVKTIVSNEGMAACTTIPGSFELPIIGGPPVVSFEYHWGEGPAVDVDLECSFDISEYKPAEFGGSARVASEAERRAGTQGFTLPAGRPSAVIRLDGAPGAPPHFTLTGPRGLRISYTGAPGELLSGDGFELMAAPEQGQTFVRLTHPPAGGYALADGGDATIATASMARGLPEPLVNGSIERAGKGRYALSYRLREIPGQRVTFVEETDGITNKLAVAREPRGEVSFKPATGPRGRRTVFAVVEQSGTPRARIRLASFKAPALNRPGKPSDLRLRRRGTKLVVSWDPARDAAEYAVSWALRDGRHQDAITRRRRFVIPAVPGIDAGKVKVAALMRDGVAGHPATQRLKAKPKRRGHHGP